MDDSAVRDHSEITLAVASRLPPVYKGNLIILINEVIQKQPACETLEESLRLLFSYFPARSSVAFFLQCLPALGFERDVVYQLKSKADVSLSLSNTYPQVLSRADEIKKKIKKDLITIGAEIDMHLLGFYVELVRLSLSRTLLPPSTMPETFYEMFDRLLSATGSPSETASVVHAVLSYFHCNVKELGPYLIPGFNLRLSYPKIYFKLRFAEFLYSLGEDDCKLAMMAFSRIHLNNEAIDKYSPLEFIERLFYHGEADIAMLNKLAECFNQPNYFSICEQQQQNESKAKLMNFIHFFCFS